MEHDKEQEEAQFESDFGDLLRGQSQASTCPDSDELIDWSSGALAPDDSGRISQHVKQCTACASLCEKLTIEPAEVDDLTWARARAQLDQRAWPWKKARNWNTRWAGLAAAGIAAVAVALVWFQPASVKDISPVTRGTTPITVSSPTGAVSRLEFRWKAMAIHDAYVVEVASGEELVFSREVAGPPLIADQAMLSALASDSAYVWRVRTVDQQGRTMAESEWLEFQLRE